MGSGHVDRERRHFLAVKNATSAKVVKSQVANLSYTDSNVH